MAEKLIPFQINAISISEFATIDNVFEDGEEVHISTGFDFGVDEDQYGVAVAMDMSFDCHENPFIILKIRMDFSVEPKAFSKLIKKNKLVLPKGFLIHLAALTVSTSRGILYSKLDGTELDHIILPAINVSEILNEDAEFDL